MRKEDYAKKIDGEKRARKHDVEYETDRILDQLKSLASQSIDLPVKVDLSPYWDSCNKQKRAAIVSGVIESLKKLGYTAEKMAYNFMVIS